MSRLAQALQHRDSGRRIHLLQPFEFTRIEESYSETTVIYEPAKVYTVSAVVETRIVTSTGNPGELATKVEAARKAVVREIFGEYVDPLHRAIHHLHNYEVDHAAAILKAVLANFEEPTPMQRQVAQEGKQQ